MPLRPLGILLYRISFSQYFWLFDSQLYGLGVILTCFVETQIHEQVVGWLVDDLPIFFWEVVFQIL